MQPISVFLFRLFLASVSCLTLQNSHAAAANEEQGIDISNLPALDPAHIAEVAKQRKAYVESVTALGKKMFFDPTLSASGKMSCATCHSPTHAYGPPNDLSVQLGGSRLNQSGTRAVPSLRYLQTMPRFTEHYIDEDFNGGADNGPTGGHTADGRAGDRQEQAGIPLLSPNEMANLTASGFAKRLGKAKYADEFKRLFGADVFKDPKLALEQASMALDYFQQTPAEFYPYSSKYDEFLRGKAKLSKQEQRGLAWFASSEKGNCASCHGYQISTTGAFPQFTDYGYGALGVPRNQKIPANKKSDYYDMGLCGPARTDLKDKTEYCGMFKVPSLRNASLRQSFFHNGVFHSLRQVMEFYVDRDIHPERWYSRDAKGKVKPYDDLPVAYHDNVNDEAPFDRGPGQAPRLSKSEIKDVIAFMKTLTDAYPNKSKAAPTARH